MKKTIEIYTDGACTGNPGPGGYGAVLMYNGRCKELSGGRSRTTNNRMEILAVIEALGSLKEPCAANIYSDSRYVVDAIEKGWVERWRRKGWMRDKTSPALNVDLWQKVQELLAIHETRFIWVKGHADNKWNERCDQLAREYIKTGRLIPDEGYQ